MLVILLIILIAGCERQEKTQLDIIFDTDISSDVDDVGAVAVLHALADKREVSILAMAVSSGDSWSAPCLQTLNAWFGRPEIPVGMAQGRSVTHESLYTKTIAQEYAQSNNGASPVVDAVPLYRKTLSARPDKSVTIITVGYLTNLHNLMLSQADSFSSLDGIALIRQKVRQVVCMGGEFPAGREWNFYQDASATRTVIENWPTPIVFCGFEIGKDILTGAVLQKEQEKHPVRRSYELYNGLQNRSSWDQLTVLYAARGEKDPDQTFFRKHTGEIRITGDGSNTWVDGPGNSRSYVQRIVPAADLAEVINALMTQH